MTSTQDIYWLAGLLEGDGCFTAAMKRYPVIRLHMYDRDIVARADRLFYPGRKRKRLSVQHRLDRKQSTYQATASGPRAIGWMMTLYPLMGVRRQARIRELLAMWRQRGVNPAATLP